MTWAEYEDLIYAEIRRKQEESIIEAAIRSYRSPVTGYGAEQQWPGSVPLALHIVRVLHQGQTQPHG